MKTTAEILAALLGGMVLAGCPNGSDRVFGVYGIYYSFEPGGYVWAEYRVPCSKKSETNPTEAFRLAAGDLLEVVRGGAPLRNSLSEDMKSAQFVAIAGYYSDFKFETQKITDVRFGVVFFPISDLARVAKAGPAGNDVVTSEVGPDERIFDFAKRWSAGQRKEPNKPPLRMPVSGTPAASASAEATADRGAPVAPPPGIAGR